MSRQTCSEKTKTTAPRANQKKKSGHGKLRLAEGRWLPHSKKETMCSSSRGQPLQCSRKARWSGQPILQPWPSCSLRNLLAVQMPLQLTRIVPTMRPDRRDLVVWQSVCRRVPSGCLLTSPRVLLAWALRPLMASYLSLSPFAARLWHILALFFCRRISQSTFAVQLSYLLVGALCLERGDCVFETRAKHVYMQTCRCHWLRVLPAENRVGNGDLQSRLPAFLPYAPSCWAAAACGHRGFGHSTWLAQRTHSTQSSVSRSKASACFTPSQATLCHWASCSKSRRRRESPQNTLEFQKNSFSH